MSDHHPTQPHTSPKSISTSVESNQTPQSQPCIDAKLENDGASTRAGRPAGLWKIAKHKSFEQVKQEKPADSAEVVVMDDSDPSSVVMGNMDESIPSGEARHKSFQQMQPKRTLTSVFHDTVVQAKETNRMNIAEAKLKVLRKKDHVVGGTFANLDLLKGEAHEEFYKDDVDVTDLYSEEGIAQWIARSEVFSRITLGVICANSVWLGVEADQNRANTLAEADTYVQVVEYSFGVFFFSEIVIRFLAFERKLNAMTDSWFKFDSFLVCLMMLETWIMPAMSGDGIPINTAFFRTVRLARLSRLMRLGGKFPELVTLVKGLTAALRSVSSTLFLLVLCMYVFAVIFRQQIDGSNEVLEGYFGSMGQCFWTLLLHGTLLDGVGFVLKDLKENSPVLAVVMLLFILLANLTILNMLIGVLCEVVNAVGQYEKDTALVHYTKATLMAILKEHDDDQSRQLKQPEFEKFVRDPKVKDVLDNLGVNQDSLLRSAEVMFSTDEDESSLPFGVILEHILGLRSSNTALVGDVMDLQHFIKMSNDKTNEYLIKVTERQQQLLDKVEANETRQQYPLTSCIPDSGQANSSSVPSQVEEMPVSLSLLSEIHRVSGDSQIPAPQRAEKDLKLPKGPSFCQGETAAELDQKLDGIIQNMQIKVQQLTPGVLHQKVDDIMQSLRIEVEQLIRQVSEGTRYVQVPPQIAEPGRISSGSGVAKSMPTREFQHLKHQTTSTTASTSQAAPAILARDCDEPISQKQNQGKQPLIQSASSRSGGGWGNYFHSESDSESSRTFLPRTSHRNGQAGLSEMDMSL